ncbi:protein MpPKC5 [Marchantia polymorpha subsp. ruderalis]
MPLESSESSDSSDSDEFDLKNLILAHHQRRAMNTDFSTRARSRSRREGEDSDSNDDVVSSSASPQKRAEPRSDSTRTRRSRRATRGDLRDVGLSQNDTNDDDEDRQDTLPSTRGPYHALQLAADRLTSEMQDDIAQQLESVEEQLEAVGLQMQETIAAGFKDGTFKSRPQSLHEVRSGRRSFPINNPQPTVDSWRNRASNYQLRDRSSQTSPTSKRYSSRASTHVSLNKDNGYTSEADLPLKRKSEGEGNLQTSRLSTCQLCGCEDASEDGISASSVQQHVTKNSGYEYQILKLEGMVPGTEGSTSNSGASTSSYETRKAEARIVQARGCQTCRCHGCRVPSDPVQAVQILGVVGNSQGESLASGSREFVTMDVKNGRISQNLGLIEICRDYQAQEGQYDHIWKPASVLQQFNVERSGSDMIFPSTRDEESQLLVDRPFKELTFESKSIGALEGETSNSSDSFEKKDFATRRKDSRKSRVLHDRPSQDVDTTEYTAGLSNPLKNNQQFEMDDNNDYQYDRDELPSQVVGGNEGSSSSGRSNDLPRNVRSEVFSQVVGGNEGSSSSGRSNDLTRNVRSEVFSVIDKEFEYVANDSTSSQSNSDKNQSPSLNEYGARQRASQEYRGSPRRERNSSDLRDSREIIQEQRHSSSAKNGTEAQSFQRSEIDALKFEEAHILSGPRRSRSKEKRGSKGLHSSYEQEGWSHQQQQKEKLPVDDSRQDPDDESVIMEESSAIMRPYDNPLFHEEPVADDQSNTKRRSGTKVPPFASSSNYQLRPSLESSSRLAAGEVSADRETSGKPSLDFSIMESKPDHQSWSSEKSREMETDEANKRSVAQSRLYIDIRQEYEPGDHVSHEEMQSRLQQEIAKEFALLGIQSGPPRKRVKDKSDGANRSHKVSVVVPDNFKLEDDSSHVDNVYGESSDLQPKAGRSGDVRGSSIARLLDDGHVNSGNDSQRDAFRSSVAQRLADVGRSKTSFRTDYVSELPGPSNKSVAHRRPTPYPAELGSEARRRKEEFIRQLNNTQKRDDFPAQIPLESESEESRSGHHKLQALEQQDWPPGGSQIPIRYASEPGKRSDAIVQILNEKSTRVGGRRKSRETSVQHIVSSIPRGSSSFMPPISEIFGSKSRRNSLAQMELNANRLESLDSSMPLRTRGGAQIDVPGQFPDSRTREPQLRSANPRDEHEINPGRHPTMIDQNWNNPSNFDDFHNYDDGNCEKGTKRNLQTLNSKGSQKYLAKMLTTLSQKLGVLESKGLIESQTPLEQGRVDSESEEQFDCLRLRKSPNFNQMRRGTRGSNQLDFHSQTQGEANQEFVGVRKIPHLTHTLAPWNYQNFRDSMLANNLELLSAEMASRRNTSFENQDIQEEWQPGTPHSLRLKEQTEVTEAETRHQNEDHQFEIVEDSGSDAKNQSSSRPSMPYSFNDTPIRSSLHHPKSRISENWEVRNRQSIQTQTLDRMNAEDEVKPTGGQVQASSEPSSSSEVMATLKPSSNSEEPSWDRSLETWNPRASRGGGLKLQNTDLLKAIEQSHAQNRNSTSVQTEEHGLISRPSFKSEVHDYPDLERTDSMETQPGDLAFGASDYLENHLKRSDPFLLSGERLSYLKEAGIHQHSKDRRSSSMRVQSEEEESRDRQYSRLQVPKQSDLRDLEARSRQLTQIPRINHVNLQHARESQTGRMHSFAVEPPEYRSSGYHLVDAVALSRHPSEAERMYSFAVQPEGMVYDNPRVSTSRLPHGSLPMEGRTSQNFQTGRMYSLAVQPESMEPDIHNHSQTGRRYSHEMEADNVEHGYRHNSQTGRMYNHAMQPEQIGLGIRLPSQGENMYGVTRQPEVAEFGNRQHPQSRGSYSFPEQPEALEFQSRHHTQERRSSNPPVQMDGMESENRRESQIGGLYSGSNQYKTMESQSKHTGGMYGFQEQSESMESQSRHPSRKIRMSNLPVHPEGADTGFHRTSKYDHSMQPGVMNSVFRHSSQSGRIGSVVVQSEGMEAEGRHYSLGGEIYGQAEQPEIYRHPSQEGRMSNISVYPVELSSEGRHHSQLEKMHNVSVLPEALDFRSAHPSQTDRMHSFSADPGDVDLVSRHPSQNDRIHSFSADPGGVDLVNRHPSQNDRIHSFSADPGGVDLVSRHPSQNGRMNSFSADPGGVDSVSRHPSQNDRIHSFSADPGGVDPVSRHPSQNDRIQSFSADPGSVDLVSRHPSQIDRMHSFEVEPGARDSGIRHPPHIDRKHSFEVEPGAIDSGSRHPSQNDRMHSLAMQAGAVDSGSRHPSVNDRMHGLAVKPGAMNSASRHSSQTKAVHSFVVQPDVTDSQREQKYSFGGRLESSENPSGRHSQSAKIKSSGVQAENMESEIQRTSHDRLPEFRTSEHSIAQVPKKMSKKSEVLPTQKKSTFDRDPVKDLPPEVISLGTKNPRKSSQIQMLNDMLQDLEATVTKSRQNSQARRKTHMLVNEFPAVAARSKKMSKRVTLQVPEEEESNLEETVDEKLDRFDDRKLDLEEVEISKPLPEQFDITEFPDDNTELNHQDEFDREQPGTNTGQFGGEHLEFEDEQLRSYGEDSDGENLDPVEGRKEDDLEVVTEESPLEEQQDLQSYQDGSLDPIDESDAFDQKDSLASRRLENSTYSSGSSSGVARTSSAFNRSTNSRLSGSQRHSQAKMNEKNHQYEEVETELQSTNLMSEELEIGGTSDAVDPGEETEGEQLATLENEGEELVPFETQDEELTSLEYEGEEITPFDTRDEELTYLENEGEEAAPSETQSEELTYLENEGDESIPRDFQGEELTSLEDEGEEYITTMTEGEELTSIEAEGDELIPFETEGEELTSLEAQDDHDLHGTTAEATRIDERRITSRGLQSKDQRLEDKGKGKIPDSIVKDFISRGSNSRHHSGSK